MKSVILHGRLAAGRVALVDDADWPLVAACRWSVFEVERSTGGRPTGPYAMASIRRDGRHTTTLMHKLITGWPRTDHIDHDGLNNQRSNLRQATCAQNMHNRRPGTPHSSQYKGVSWSKRAGKWQALIKAEGKARWLGTFASEEQAAIAYNIAALELHGQFACLNLIQEAA